jgi:hypothetical protein
MSVTVTDRREVSVGVGEVPPPPPPAPGQFVVEFCNVNDPFARYIIVCADKRWGEPGCAPWTGDWVIVDPGIGMCVRSPPISASRLITAVTSSDDGYYYRVTIYDAQGNAVRRCDRVDRNNPCVHEIVADRAVVVDYTIQPASPRVNEPVSITVRARVESSTGQRDFVAGVIYVDGPADEIASPCGSLKRGEGCWTRAPSRSTGTEWGHSGVYAFRVAGVYKIALAAGYVT